MVADKQGRRPVRIGRQSQGRLGGSACSGGTDHISFFNHLGYPPVAFDFEGAYGVYHSIFDNHRWMKQFGDPKILYHVCAARLFGLIAVRLAEADLLPLDYETYDVEIERQLEGSRTKLALLGQAHQVDFQFAQRAAKELASSPGATRAVPGPA